MYQAGDRRMDSSSATDRTVVRVGQTVQPLWAAESEWRQNYLELKYVIFCAQEILNYLDE